MTEKISFMRRLNLIFRFSYTLPFFLASVCGSLFAYAFYEPPLHIVVLMPLVVLLLAIFVNFSNDYFDHRSGVDKSVAETRFSDAEDKAKALDSKLLEKIYWAGNPFDDGLVTDRQGKAVMALLVIISIALAVPIILYGGLIVILFGAVGIFLSYFYTAPPINMGARGLGEVNVAVSFFMLVFCSFYVATVNLADAVIFSVNILDPDVFTLALGVFDVKIFVFAMMIGTLVGLMRLIDSLSGHEAHVANGEKNIAVRIGLDGTVKVAKFFMISAYVLAGVMVYLNPVYALLFLTLPLAAKAWKVTTEKKDHWTIRSPPLFFGNAFLTEVLFIASVVTISVLGIGPLF